MDRFASICSNSKLKLLLVKPPGVPVCDLHDGMLLYFPMLMK